MIPRATTPTAPDTARAAAPTAPVTPWTSVELPSPKLDQDSLQIPLTPRAQAPSDTNSPSASASVSALSRQNDLSSSGTSSSGTSSSGTSSSGTSAQAPTTGVQRRASGTPYVSTATAAVASSPLAAPSRAAELPTALRDSSSETPTITKDNIKSLGQAPAPKQHAVSADVRAAVSAVAGTSPASVTLHRGAAVDKKAQALNADAFAHEGAIHIPGTTPLISDKSRQILAHELTHVVQQQQYGKTLPPENTPLGRQLEASALHAETLVSSSPKSSISPTISPTILSSFTSTSTSESAPTPAMPSAAAQTTSDMTPARREGQTPTRSATGAQEITLARGQSQPDEVVLSPRRLPTVAAPAALGSTMGNQPTWSGRIGSGQTQGGQGAAGQFSSAPPAPFGQPSAPEQVQRRSRAQDTKHPTAAKEIAQAKQRKEQAPRAAPAVTPPPTSFTSDARWLEQHANALYPLIRNMLRADLLKDRERRSKLMREY